MILVDADELKQVKIDVKMSIFLQFLLHLFIWCHLCILNNMDIEKSKMNQTKSNIKI